MSILSTKNLIKHFDGVHAVDSLSISFEAGKVTALIGPNGSGKSTLINTLTGLHAMDGGIVRIGEKTELTKIDPSEVASYGLTRTFQDVRLFEQMTVLDNILVVLTDRGIASAFVSKHNAFHLEKAEEVLRKVGLWDKRNELALGLSYGQRKLAEIARILAMIHSPSGEAQVFFFDEPFAGLFPEMIKVVVSAIKELRAAGKTVILVEHNMDLIRELSDHVFVLDAGKILAQGTAAQVLSNKEVIEAYLGE
ncbi:MAG TPA: ABC transporter ATP-binding protein [Candidatus Paceibacterota bacterium]